jgi:carbonic anhydrase
VPVEEVFDEGIGDLFVVRVLGNVSDVDEIGSMEYAVAHLGIGTIVVLGHAKCGAVTAVVNKDPGTPDIELLVDNIVPAVEAARKADPNLSGDELIARAIQQNVIQSISDLRSRSKTVDAAVKAGKLKIVGGVYDLETRKVKWLTK